MLADRGVQAFLGTGLGLVALWSLGVAAAWVGTTPLIVLSVVWALVLVPLVVVSWRRSGRLGALMLLLPTVYGAAVVVGGEFDGNACDGVGFERTGSTETVGRSLPPGVNCRVVWEDGSVSILRESPDGFFTVLALGLVLTWAILARARPAVRIAVGVVAPVVALGVLFS